MRQRVCRLRPCCARRTGCRDPRDKPRRLVQNGAGLLDRVAQIGVAPIESNQVEQIAMLAGRGIGPFAGCAASARRPHEADEQAAPRIVMHIPGEPVVPTAPPLREIFLAHGLRVLGKAGREVSRSARHGSAPLRAAPGVQGAVCVGGVPGSCARADRTAGGSSDSSPLRVALAAAVNIALGSSFRSCSQLARYWAWSARTSWVMPSSAQRKAEPISATSSSAATSALPKRLARLRSRRDGWPV